MEWDDSLGCVCVCVWGLELWRGEDLYRRSRGLRWAPCLSEVDVWGQGVILAGRLGLVFLEVGACAGPGNPRRGDGEGWAEQASTARKGKGTPHTDPHPLRAGSSWTFYSLGSVNLLVSGGLICLSGRGKKVLTMHDRV